MSDLIVEPQFINDNQALIFVKVPPGFNVEGIDEEVDHHLDHWIKVAMRRQEEKF